MLEADHYSKKKLLSTYRLLGTLLRAGVTTEQKSKVPSLVGHIVQLEREYKQTNI